LKSKEFVEINTIRIFSWPSTLCRVFSYSNCTFPTSWTPVLGVLYRLYVLMWWKTGWGSTFLAIVISSNNHHNVFPPIRSVCYRFLHCDYRKLQYDYRKLHCDYRKLHCDYRKLHCCFGLTALKSTNHSRVISLCILL
jgi:hypothetical protein